MATRARLQRRIGARQAAAGNATNSSPAAIPKENACNEKNLRWPNLGLLDLEVDNAEDCCMSLVEEFYKYQPETAFVASHYFPKNWSLHRVVTAISICPLLQDEWQHLVSRYGDLSSYYVRLEGEVAETWTRGGPSPLALLLRRNALQLAKMCVPDGLLLAIFGHLDGWDLLGLVAVCRRWHFVARRVCDRTEAIQLGSSQQLPALSLIRTHKFVFRFPTLTSITLSGGICISVSSLAQTFDSNIWYPIDTLRIYNVTFVFHRVSHYCANQEICEFLRSREMLKELVLVDAKVGLHDAARKRLEVRSLDLWYFQFHHVKSNQPLPIESVQLSLPLVQRFPEDIFRDFQKQLMQSKPKAIILCGSSNRDAGLSRPIFTRCLAWIMPHLREISLCNVSFSDGNRLGAQSLELLSKQIGYNSNLELFCLTKGEISEEATCNLQRCAKLQVLILLRCEIVKAHPELALLAGWHPRADLPSSLITDDVTVPRWLKPRYFRVVRVDNFTEFRKTKFVNLRKSLWTVRALMKSSELRITDFYFPSLYLDPEEIVADAVWLHV